MGLNGKGGNWCCPGGHLIKSDKPLRIGGIVPQDPEQNRFVGDNVKFQGYIDEVRISVSYDMSDRRGKSRKEIQVDKHTISLWHFDETPGLSRFKDASGNGHHLWRSGVIGGLTIEAQGKLTTTWGKLKQ